ncbi:antibiotic biosynthesis monooxygenase family protein [Teredinibacter waterburyi]|jgi:Antibiotic biosynthesis monooxygenase.|uniref:antibiotic biosynthesis monooxygenase family protein n=1 Tax=Teredinibacter waterburyi TaxID=1500538 RepID=UPI00165FA78F|nr:antibiotic biosynthesis monooxygenase [Teredinibacter waterburyi]
MVHVLIERHLHEQMLNTYIEHSRKALQRTYLVPGFISGEAFADISDENHRFLLCKWKTLEDWRRWASSGERLELLAPIHSILKQPEKVSVLEN